jgi:sugar phosphate isomerase/epimerase
MTRIGVQLWTVRDQLADVGPLFEQLAAVGVEAVEPYGLGKPDSDISTRITRARELRRAADDAGLAIVSTHTYLPSPTDVTPFIDEMLELGVTYALASAPEHLNGFTREVLLSADSIHKYAETLNALADKVEPSGIRIGYHNHYWEWNELEDGTFAYDLLWDNLGEKVIAEVDVLWATFAGQDAVEIVSRLKDRTPLLHVGDASPINNTEFQLPAGSGVAPLTAAMEVSRALDAVYIEATTPPPGSTQIDLIRQSVEWLRTVVKK